MRRILSFHAFWLALVSGVCAQMTVEVKLDQDQFLPGESIPAQVRIVNRSGQTLHLGEEANWLTFSVESKENFIVSKNGDVPVTGAFDLESSQFAAKWVNLAPYFNVTKPGRYEITATIRIKNWDTQFASPAKSFDLIQGSRLWEQTFGVPNTSTNAGETPEMRKYILQQANYLRSQLRLYLRLTDVSEAQAIRVFAIGPMVSFSRPEPQVDQQSNLHVLYQDGPRTFSYTVVNPNGDVTVRQTYDFVNSRPRLKVGDNGKISVVGGVRHEMPGDVPAPKLSPVEPKPAPAPPVSTPKP